MSTPNTDDTNKTPADDTKPGDGKGTQTPKPKPNEEGKPGAGGEPPKTFTQDDLAAAEARGRRVAEADAKKKEDEGKLSTEEREKRRADEAEARLRTREARDVLEEAAKDAGASNPTKLYRLVKDDLEFDDNGKPTNLKEVLVRAKREFPDEFGSKRPPGSADGGAGRGSGTGRTMNDLIRGRR